MITSKSKKKEAAVRVRKNYRPPRPMGVKGGCSPQNNRRKPLRLVNELPAGGNKFLYENFHFFRPVARRDKTSDELEEING
jgi:hypothetical protein